MPFNKLDHHNLGEIRPRFRLKSSLKLEEVKELLNKRIEEDKTVIGKVRMDYAIIKIPTHLQHYWSPELQIHLEKDEESDDTLIRCLLGPAQAVWALFMFFYVTIILLTMFLGMYGLVRWNLGEFNNFVYIVPAAVFLLPSIYIVSKLGQRTGHEQMMHLVSFLYHCLDKAGKVERVES